MSTVRKTVTIPADLADEAQAFAGSSFSAYVTDALRRRVAADRLSEFVALDAEQRGPLDADELDAARTELAALDRE